MTENPAAEKAPHDDHVRTSEMALALRNGLKMGGSLMVTWAVALIVKVRVPVHLGPIRQGHFGFAESFATMFFSVMGLGIDTHIIKEVSVRPKYASEIVGGVLALRLLLSVVLFGAMAVVLWVTGRSGEILYAAIVFACSQLLMSINGTLGAVLQANSRVDAPVVANIVAKVVWAIGLLLGLQYDVPLAILALPALVGEVLRLAILDPATRRGGELRYRVDVPAVRAAIFASIPYFVNALALGILSSLSMTVLGFIRHDEREVGWFNAVQNVAYLCSLLTPMLFWVVTPLLARAHARSEEEGMTVFRRCLEGVVLSIVPVTVLISAGSDILIRIAFHEAFAPASTGLAILSLVFMMTYMNTMLAQNLIVMGRGWSVTTISISSVFINAAMMLVFVPLGRKLMGEGGECAGAATSVICSEAVILILMFTRFRQFPLDARNVRVFSKSVVIAVLVLVLDRQMRALGAARLAVDAVLYVGLALAVGVVRPHDVGLIIRLLRHRGDAAVAPAASAGP